MYLGAEHLMGFLMFVPSAQWYSYLGWDKAAFSTSESLLMGLQGCCCCSQCSHTLPPPFPSAPSHHGRSSLLQSCSITSCSLPQLQPRCHSSWQHSTSAYKAQKTQGVWQEQLPSEPQGLDVTDHTRGFMQSSAASDTSVLSICLANLVLSEQLLGEYFHHKQIWGLSRCSSQWDKKPLFFEFFEQQQIRGSESILKFYLRTNTEKI